MNIYVILTDFNGYPQTKECLQRLSASTVQSFTTVVVDHGTSDETRRGISEDFPEVQRIEGTPDLWWAGATNLGVKFALRQGAKSLILLNNDCYVRPETIEKLVDLSSAYPESIIAPVQRDYFTGHLITVRPNSFLLWGFLTRPGSKSIPSGRDVLVTKLIAGGRGVIIPARVFAKIGLFDEKNLPHYWADHDFYFRARKKGVPLLVAPGAEVEIDNTRTTIAKSSQDLSLSEFWSTLFSIRSHRNISHVNELFKKHYPIKSLYKVGVYLYIGRYIAIYFVKRVVALLSRRL
jgi:GT2 family glycosyltransferase